MAEETELKLEEVTTVAPEELTEEQTTFLKENTDSLTEEQKEIYKDTLAKKEEVINPDDINPEIRFKEEEKKLKDKKEEDEENEDDDILPEDEKQIGRIIDKKTKAFSDGMKELQGIKDEREVDSFIATRPEFGKYKPVIMKYLSHPAYKNIPVYNIASIVAAKDLEKMGAQKEREAQKKANNTKSLGVTVRKLGGKTDWHTASKEDYEAQRAKVLQRQG